ncbi:MAG: hypothetical protein Q9213_007523 [Squamulea squamosa]
MFFSRILVALSISSGFIGVAFAQQITLKDENLQKASAKDGQGQGEKGVKAGQSPSATDKENFINFCTGKTKTNGAQIKGGSCNGIPMGDIPATTNMVATILTNPTGGCIDANKDFDVSFNVANLNVGTFTNPEVTYYQAPQALKGGNIVGHVHVGRQHNTFIQCQLLIKSQVTCQTLGNNLTPNQPPKGDEFVFFKGVDDQSNKATVAGVIMPVAQRGAQDDCVRFEVSENCAAGAGNNANTNNKAKADTGNGGNGTGNADSNSSSNSASNSASNSDSNSTSNSGNTGNGTFNAGNIQQGNAEVQDAQEQGRQFGSGRRRRQRFQVREYIL